MLIGTGIAASITAWKSNYLSWYHPVAATIAFFLGSLSGTTGVCLLLIKSIALAIAVAMALAIVIAMIEANWYDGQFYRT